METKPNVLVLGGTGFIGRNLVKMLVDSGKCDNIRVVDKVFPQTAFLSPDHAAVYDNPKCVFVQGNLVNAQSIAKCFQIDGSKFHYVFNCAAETKYGQEIPIYREKTRDLAKKVAEEAIRTKADKFVHLSNAQIYKSNKKPTDENGPTDPWTALAEVQLETEKELTSMITRGLNLVILRPALVYGPGDTSGLAPRIICAAVYKYQKKTMKFLWTGELKLNTVHVFDVVGALWHAAVNLPVGAVYNLADKNDTDQEKVNKILEAIFGIKTGFEGKITSNLAKTFGMRGVTDGVNDEHLKPWSDLCKEKGIGNTPLSPYLDPELLYEHHLSINGSAIEKTGFIYQVPHLNEQLVREQIMYFASQKLFPGF